MGDAKFTADLALPGMLFAKVLRSPYAHARILGIDTSRAERLPGVRAIISGNDVLPYKWGVFPYTRDQQLLPKDRARYFSEEIAAVAAVDEDTAAEAIDLIKVEYEPMPVLLDPEASLKEGAILIHDDKPGNVSVRIFIDSSKRASSPPPKRITPCWSPTPCWRATIARAWISGVLTPAPT
jgi:CO/xanthine dehydrogenase Mo-binding subunit